MKISNGAKIELRAGLTTYLSMAYILAVNPQILGNAITIPGVDLYPQLLSATAIAAAIGSIAMGVWARYPFGMAPGMGLNAYFAFSVCLGMQVHWKGALAASFVAGIIFLVLSVSGIRTYIVDAIPLEIKRAMTAGIGLFLAIIGFTSSGIVVDHPQTLVSLGDLTQSTTLVALFGLICTTALLVRKVPGALLIGVGLSTFLAILLGAPVFGGQSFSGFPNGIAAIPELPRDIFFALDFSALTNASMWLVILSFLLVDFFDTAGTLYGISERAGLLNERGELKRSSQAFAADAVATSIGALLGTSPVTTYVESATGVAAGGRTGLTAIVIGILFLLSLFLWPLFGMIPVEATAPVLIVVGAMMMSTVSKLDWEDYRVALPCFLTIVGMPFTYSISNGIALGIISWVLIHHMSGKSKEVSLLMNGLALLLGLKIFIH
jgi:adenine/guanine/hypoxanthine permease